MIDSLDRKYHNKINRTPNTKMLKIMDMMKSRIHFY